MNFDILDTDIAIIGMSARLPGAKNITEFWRNLHDGVESIRQLSDEELLENIDGKVDYIGLPLALQQMKDPNYVKAAAYLDDIDQFDAAFFGINPSEAELLDPQQRLFLECAWEAMENAGYDMTRYPGLVGVYAGSSFSRYYLTHIHSNRELSYSERDFLAGIGNEGDYVPTRVSYKLNLRGPSINVQTACSTSLVAIHLAVQALVSGDCDMALAGGVTLRSAQKLGYYYREGGMVSPDGQCRAFDARANGTVFGNGGLGIVVLKRLSEAVSDGDHIYAVIKGSAVNNDGALKAGYTAPAIAGQAEVISAALSIANIHPETISYIEAHGTATPLGDPIEISALNQVFQAQTDRKGFCAIGSVKTNIGHLAVSAGIAGIIKVALALEHEQIPPSLHYELPNPRIDFAQSPFFVNTQLRSWKRGEHPRRAGVSSFGVGGTNAHIVLEEAPPVRASSASRPWQVLLLAAKTPTALETMTDNLATYLQEHPKAQLPDVAATLQRGRKLFSHRRMIVCRNHQDAIAAIQSRDPKYLLSRHDERVNAPVVFMFSGQGAQYVHMGAELYHHERVFREQVDTCALKLKPLLHLDLRDLLYPATGHEAAAQAQLDQTAITQPALFVIEYALAQLWISWGIQPQAMIGHSIGEYVAACLAGVLTLKDALKLVATRGTLMQSLPTGAMTNISSPETKVRDLLDAQLSIAAINGPNDCVVSGPYAAIEQLEERLAAQEITYRRLHTSHAFHSVMMEPILAKFTTVVSSVTLHPPLMPYISNVTGTWITEDQATDPGYWAHHLRSAVRFADGIKTILEQENPLLLEVGPGRTLCTLAKRSTARKANQLILSSLRHPQDTDADMAFLLQTLGRLWQGGATIDWQGFYADEQRQHLPLPSYPFERKRFWIEPKKQAAGDSTDSLMKKPDLADWFYVPSWRRSPLPHTSLTQNRRWLIFIDPTVPAQSLLLKYLNTSLHLNDNDVIIVRAGKDFKQFDPFSYQIKPTDPQHYRLVLAALEKEQRLPQCIIHLWNVYDTEAPGTFSDDDLQQRSFFSLLYLAQALGECPLTEKLQVGVISNAMHEVHGEAVALPQRAVLLGPCKVVPFEYNSFTYRNIDLPAIRPDNGASLAQYIIRELLENREETVVAYREDYRWVQTQEPLSIKEQHGTQARLKEKGVYLITGGLGGIGLTLARYLAQTVQARLVLVGRSKLPEHEHWAQWLATYDSRDEVSKKIRTLLEIEAQGAQVLVMSADVTQLAEMRAVIEQAQQAFGEINGIIHAAGIPGGGLIQLKTPEATAKVLAPKVKGVQVLTQALQQAPHNAPLDFLALCSSTFAVTGGIGQVDYCAANAFMDAFAQHSRIYSDVAALTISINWDAWQEVGMAVHASHTPAKDTASPQLQHRLDHPLLHGIESETAEQITFVTKFCVKDHWILDEHRILGTAALPGTAYLEMARAALEAYVGSQHIELRDIYFVTPLSVTDLEKKAVRLLLKPEAIGYSFRIVSRMWLDDGEEFEQEHAGGRILEMTSPATKDVTYDLSRLEQAKPMGERGQMGTQGFLQFGPHWNNLSRVKFDTLEGWAELELDARFASEPTTLKLHPALLDVATSFAIRYVGKALYLPWSYKRVTMYKPLTARIYSYARCYEEPSPESEFVSFDLIIADEQGQVALEIEEFTMKRVHQSATKPGKEQVLAHTPKKTTSKAGGYQGDLTNAIGPDEGVEAFRRIMSGEYGPQVIVFTRDLPTAIKRLHQSTASATSAGETMATSSVQPRPEVQTKYVPPSSTQQQDLVDIWQKVLGIEQVGIHDNFFELGGDSVLAIQVVARAKQRGIALASNQLFQYPTVLALAQSLGDTPSEPAATQTDTTDSNHSDATAGTLMGQHTEHREKEANAFSDTELSEQALAQFLAKFH